MRYWLMKSEPADCSIDDLAALPQQTVAWYGVRNYQARNFMRDMMRIGDQAFFYHSSCPRPGIAGIVKIASLAYPDDTQFDPASRFFDAKSARDNPRWLNVDVQLVRKTPFIDLAAMRAAPELEHMRVLQKASRLSITPVAPEEWQFLCRLMESAAC